MDMSLGNPGRFTRKFKFGLHLRECPFQHDKQHVPRRGAACRQRRCVRAVSLSFAPASGLVPCPVHGIVCAAAYAQLHGYAASLPQSTGWEGLRDGPEVRSQTLEVFKTDRLWTCATTMSEN